MFLNPLDRILKQIVARPEWQKYRDYYQIKNYWQQAIAEPAAKNSRPLGIERDILYVATSNAVWAQELALQRYSLLKKLNKRFNLNLKDIRFSPARWHPQTNPKREIKAIEKVEKQPRVYRSKSEPVTQTELQIDARNALYNWLKKIEQDREKMLACPQCQATVTPAELDRWQVCRHCIAQQWHDEYRPPN